MQANDTQMMIDSSSAPGMAGNPQMNLMDNRDQQVLQKVMYFCGRK